MPRLTRRTALALPIGLLAACAGREGVTAAPSAAGPLLEIAPAAATAAGGFSQGGLALGRVPPGSRVTLDGRPVRVGPDGRFAIGFGRDADADARLAVTAPDGRSEIRALAVLKREWQVQRINGLPQAMVSPDARQLARINRERARIAEIRKLDSDMPHFAEGFIWPAQGRISGVFGSQRILNGEPRTPHFGLDIAAPTGTPVKAMGGGRVVLADDLYFTGNTVMVDHGRGVVSLYAHLSRMDVQSDEAVARGQVLGAIGATGRATGPHLHLGLHWLATPLDPQPLLPAA
ncbi:M23 family metallopeptidase [Teichococcus oryzae]|uniref:M23 family metallopeptidase n=1 Tax=Teichococcus oryzae TaxID=1608942 RepID=A0A5B2TF60_9PROT|nr:M23 family metallopeptidase [Pseudoroseomonas oryzae]KAA2213136.1 M23 family metallopeptidase [Pseudoroseomonas oryzae]